MAETTVSNKKPVAKKPAAAKKANSLVSEELPSHGIDYGIAGPSNEDIAQMKATTPQQRLHMKLLAASKVIKAVSKDGENDFQHYSFQSEGAIKDAVKPALESNGLMIIPRYEILGQHDVPGKRGTNHVVDVLGTFTLTDGIEEYVGTMVASGADTLEKATMKACTSAQKNYYKQLFNITDNDPDPDTSDSGDGYQPNNSQPQYNQPQQQQQVSHTLINAFQASLTDAAAKHGVDLHTAGSTVFAAAGVPVKAYTKLTQAEFNELDKALMSYTKQA
jgi:hypothetical protein